jgi:hypothetical protein
MIHAAMTEAAREEKRVATRFMIHASMTEASTPELDAPLCLSKHDTKQGQAAGRHRQLGNL